MSAQRLASPRLYAGAPCEMARSSRNTLAARSEAAGPSPEGSAALDALPEPEAAAAAAAVLVEPPRRPRLLSRPRSTVESTDAYHSPPVPSSTQQRRSGTRSMPRPVTLARPSGRKRASSIATRSAVGADPCPGARSAQKNLRSPSHLRRAKGLAQGCGGGWGLGLGAGFSLAAQSRQACSLEAQERSGAL